MPPKNTVGVPRRILSAKPPCRHCGVGKAWKTRGLCFGCHGDRAVRDLYPAKAKYIPHRHRPDRQEDIDGPVPPPASPTDARPGTAEKVEELERRAAAGVELWHPQDLGAAPEYRRLLLVPGVAG
jgi:hypothetical protein